MRNTIISLILILVIGAVLRLVFLTSNPPSLNWDEVSHGYNAYAVGKTGADQWGQKFPILNFRAYGDYPTTLNLYFLIPFISVFGLSEFAIRFPHALLGIGTIVSVYFLVSGVTKRKDLSLLTAFLVAIEPWYVFTSRFVLQSNLSVFLLVTTAAFFVNRNRNKNFLFISYSLLLLTLFSYHTTRIFSPLFLLGTTLIYRHEVKNKLIYIFVGLFLLLSTIILFNPFSRVRGNLLFLVDQAAVNRIIEARNSSNLPNIAIRLLYNRPVYFAEEFSKKYISYFSPEFLFFKGGTQYQFSVPSYGLLYMINIPFFYLGLLLLLKRAKESKEYRLLLLWLVLAPIPASLTNETFAVVRATTMLPIPEILIALGFSEFLNASLFKKYSRPIILIYIISIIILSMVYLKAYFNEYREKYSWSWQYGYKEAVNYAKENYDSYDKIIVTKKYGEPHEYFLFFWPWDPASYQSDSNAIRFNQSGWWWVDKFDKFYFVNDWQVKEMKLESGGSIDCANQKCLLITSPGNYPQKWTKLETVNFLNNQPAFEIYEN